MSFGYRRAEILAALVNGSGWSRCRSGSGRGGRAALVTHRRRGGTTLVIGLIGLVVNVVGAGILWRSQAGSLNVRAAFYHVIGDLLGSLGVVVAAVLVLTMGWERADPVIAILIGGLVLLSSWRVLRESVGVLLEGTPEGIDADAVGRRMAALDGVAEVHDLHIWTITSGFPALSAHVLVAPGRGLPRPPPRAGGDARRGVRHRAHHAPGGAHERGPRPPAGVSPRSDPSGT